MSPSSRITPSTISAYGRRQAWQYDGGWGGEGGCEAGVDARGKTIVALWAIEQRKVQS